jgi:hypothetical protein
MASGWVLSQSNQHRHMFRRGGDVLNGNLSDTQNSKTYGWSFITTW